jgi:hypothetical protein
MFEVLAKFRHAGGEPAGDFFKKNISDFLIFVHAGGEPTVDFFLVKVLAEFLANAGGEPAGDFWRQFWRFFFEKICEILL